MQNQTSEKSSGRTVEIQLVARHDGRARNAAETRRRERRAANGHHVPARRGEAERPEVVELGADARRAAAAAVHIVRAADGVDRALAARGGGEEEEGAEPASETAEIFGLRKTDRKLE